MSILKHPLLLSLSKLVEQERTPFRWLDLYAAQFIADSFLKGDAGIKRPNEKTVVSSSRMGDLFDELPGQEVVLNKADIIVLALMCSQLISQGMTHLNLLTLPQDLITSAKACAYKSSFNTTQELLEGLGSLDQISVLHVVASTNILFDNEIPLESEAASNQSPLVLCQHKLYLAKYWSLHQAFEVWLQSRSQYVGQINNDLLVDLSGALNKVFSIDKGKLEEEVNWQAVSAAHTLLNPFSLITGGPGTGKTTTAASLLFMLMYKRQRQLAMQRQETAHSQAQLEKQSNHLLTEKLHVRLLAPTGKAAVKLADSIRHQLKQIETRILGNDLTSIRMSDCLPETGETVHRFLYEMGGLRDSFQRPKRFKGDEVLIKRSEHNNEKNSHQDQERTLQASKKPLDVVIVDESSMMDLALMVELVSLIPPTTQLILLGDHYQLPAVDPGQVFSECVQRFSKQKQNTDELGSLSALTTYNKNQLTEFEASDSIESSMGFQPLCSLRKTYRFGGDLKTAADQIKAGESHAFKQQFWSESELLKPESAVTWFDLELNDTIHYQAMIKGYADYFNLVAQSAPIKSLADQFERYQLLCSTLEGPLGVHFLNTYIEQRFHSSCFPNGKILGELYHGKAILVTRNHPHLGVYNGDIGFVIEDANTPNLNVYFPVANHDAIIVPPARIKEWQTAYAMTVHKSQGSEYQNVGVILADYTKELLSRALLYTALTRSKERCDIWAGGQALNKVFEI
jgi:exodeoxyribonuclease V alpha subunit